MKRLILSALLIVWAAGCAASTPPPEKAPNAATPPAPTAAPATQASAALVPINQFCPVQTENTVDPSVTYVYKGKCIGFCCEDCIPKFKDDPEKYMKDLK